MAFAPSKAKRLKTKTEPVVSLTSMMDVMTIMLLFLLKSMSVSGALMQANIDNLPLSFAEKKPEMNLAILVTQEGLMQASEGKIVRQVVSREELENQQEVNIGPLELFLLDKRDLDERLGKRELVHILTIEAAEDIPYSWILKIINTATSVGFDTFDFVVIKAY